MEEIIASNIEDLESIVIKNQEECNNSITLFDFWFEDCSPCKIQSQVLLNFHEKMQSKDSFKIFIYKINIDIKQNRELAISLNLRTFPTLILFKNEKFFILTGLMQLADLEFFTFSNPSLCINCGFFDTSKSDRKDFYYCHKNKVFLYFKDSCEFQKGKPLGMELER